MSSASGIKMIKHRNPGGGGKIQSIPRKANFETQYDSKNWESIHR
jgi:hypothetical protein